MKALTGALALAGVTVATSACGDLNATTYHEDRAYDVSDKVTTVNVKADAERVEIVGTDSPKVTVHERLSFSKGQRPTPQHSTVDGTLSLRYKCPGGITIGFNACGVSYRVTVPRSANVQVGNDSGAIRITGMAGSVRLTSDSGSINLTDLRSPSLSARTDSGSVRVAGQALTTSLTTDSGSITADGLRVSDLAIRTDSGRIRATCVQAPAKVTVNADTGGVDLALPGDQKYAVDTVSDSGSKHVRVDRDSTSPHQVKVTTDSGSIKITKR